LRGLLASANVDLSGMVASCHPTISKTRVTSRNQQLLRLDVESAEPRPAAEHQALLERALELVRTADAVILSDYDKGALTAPLCQAVIALARQRRIPVLADPKGRDFSKYAGTTTICPNLQELGGTTAGGAVGYRLHDGHDERERHPHSLSRLDVSFAHPCARGL